MGVWYQLLEDSEDKGMIRPHVPIGQLVLVVGKIPGIVLGRIDGYLYSVFVWGSICTFHRNDMILVEEDDEY